MMAEEPHGARTASDYFDFAVTDISFVVERQPDRYWRLRSFTNPRSHILAYAFSGRAHYEIEGQAYTIQGGDVIFMPRGALHTCGSDSDDPWHFVSSAFEATSASGNPFDQLRVLPYVTPLGSLPEIPAMFRDLHAAWSAKQPGYLVHIRGLIATIMYRLIHAHSLPALRQPHAQRITSITKMILDNYARTYSVPELARMADLSPSHFRHTFKQVTGMSATAFQQRTKITRATEFLTSGECNVTEAALRAGFRDVYYFSRLFKRLTGTNPSEITKR